MVRRSLGAGVIAFLFLSATGAVADGAENAVTCIAGVVGRESKVVSVSRNGADTYILAEYRLKDGSPAKVTVSIRHLPSGVQLVFLIPDSSSPIQMLMAEVEKRCSARYSPASSMGHGPSYRVESASAWPAKIDTRIPLQIIMDELPKLP